MANIFFLKNLFALTPIALGQRRSLSNTVAKLKGKYLTRKLHKWLIKKNAFDLVMVSNVVNFVVVT